MSKKLYELHKGDSKLILPELIKQGIQVDSLVTDPPYHLQSIVKRFGKTSTSDDNQTGENARNRATPGARLSKGFMGKTWDGGDIAQDVEFWELCYQILKPGGYLLAFSSTRTYHRMAVAIEDAGFIIKDQIGWLYGSGFPKSHNISKAIDRKLGFERKVLDVKVTKSGGMAHVMKANKEQGYRPNDYYEERGNVFEVTEPESEEAKQWDGWGTACKPAWEPICVAQKPIEHGLTIAENVMKYGTGGINIDACRIPIDSEIDAGQLRTDGRFPANIILSYPEDRYVLKDDVNEEQKRELKQWLNEKN